MIPLTVADDKRSFLKTSFFEEHIQNNNTQDSTIHFSYDSALLYDSMINQKWFLLLHRHKKLSFFVLFIKSIIRNEIISTKQCAKFTFSTQKHKRSLWLSKDIPPTQFLSRVNYCFSFLQKLSKNLKLRIW